MGQEFKSKLAYVPHGIEFNFLVENQKYCPDIVLGSNKLAHTLIIELTAQQAWDNHKASKKSSQIARYEALNPEDVQNSILAIPVSVSKTLDVTLIVVDRVSKDVSALASSEGWDTPIIAIGDKYLEKIHGNFSDVTTDNFFSSRWEFKRTPSRYVKFSIEHISEKALVSSVIQHLCSLIIKGVSTIHDTEFASGLVDPEVWQLLGSDRRKNIRTCVRSLLYKLSIEPRGNELVRKTDSQLWLLGSGNASHMDLTKYRHTLESFTASAEETVYQPTLDEFFEE